MGSLAQITDVETADLDQNETCTISSCAVVVMVVCDSIMSVIWWHTQNAIFLRRSAQKVPDSGSSSPQAGLGSGTIPKKFYKHCQGNPSDETLSETLSEA